MIQLNDLVRVADKSHSHYDKLGRVIDFREGFFPLVVVKIDKEPSPVQFTKKQLLVYNTPSLFEVLK